MEIYKDLTNPASQEFEKLLNTQLSKIQIEEGKIINGKINKITEKFVFLFVEGLKSEPVLDINELKSMGLADKIQIGEKIPVLLERIEELDKTLIHVVVCHHGIRSRMVAKHLVSIGFERVINLSTGVDGWANDVDPAMNKYA